MGFVDRGGGRESKGNSLRRSTKNPGAAAARAAGAKQAIKPPAQPEVAPAFHKSTKKNEFFDCSAALLSRQFDADIEDVLDRAGQNCAGIVVWSADIDKQQQVVMMSQENNGFVYAAIGLHPDNVRGTHQREFEKWFQQVEDISKMRGCVAVLSGLNLGRETATHFPQETVLKAMMATAKKNGRPLILHCAPKHAETAERLLTMLEAYHEENDNAFPTPVIMHTFLTATNFNAQLVRKFAKLGCHFTVSAAELHSLCGKDAVVSAPAADADASAAATAAATGRTKKQAEEDLAAFVDCLLSAIPAENILLASDSPWHTPQTIDDDYVRSQKNEPSNFPNIIEALELAINTFVKNSSKQQQDDSSSVDEKSLLEKLKAIVDMNKSTAVKVFAIPAKDAEVVAASPADAAEADGKHSKKDNKKNKNKGGDDDDNNNNNNDDEDQYGGGKGGKKKGNKKGASKYDDSEDEEDRKKGGGGSNKKNNKKGGKHNDVDSDAEEENNNGKKGGGKKKKGGKKGKHDDSDSEEEAPAPTKKNAKKGGKNNKHDQSDSEEEKEKRHNDSDNSEDEEEQQKQAATQKRRGGAGAGASNAAAPNNIHYACLKCRTKLFVPSDLIVPDDASLCNQGFFVKINSAEAIAEAEENFDEEEDENNKYLPATLRITPCTNGEIECRKCAAPKIGRAGFKLGVPGFGIKITPSKVESVDTGVSLEELSAKAIADALRFKQEAEDEENASSDDDGKRKKALKKNVKTNNRSNFTHFRNKNFAPKFAKNVLEGLEAPENDEEDDGWNSEPEKNEKGKRRK